MKRYVVTDPCYILPREIWSACCDKAESVYGDDWGENFDKFVQEALKDFTQGQAFVCSTGFGDWDNDLYGPRVEGLGSFCADSGMVCVCEYTGKVSDALNKDSNAIEAERAAVFEAEGPIEVDFDTSRSDWTVVEIEDANGDCWNTHIPDDGDEE